jgi:ferric-dicitrate binding protein FerR (iron transport regulator)
MYQLPVNDPEVLKDESALREELLRNVHARVGVDSRTPRYRLATLWLPLAAVIGLFVVVWFFVNEPRTSSGDLAPAEAMMQETTNAGQKLLTRLPDGTQVHLNSSTTISYPPAFGPTREVLISGEAFFDVVHDTRPFVVRAGTVATEVLGTTFNIRSRGDADPEVTLVKGSVNVIADGGNSLILKPSQQAVIRLATGEIVFRDVDVARYVSWKENVLSFEQTTLEDAIAEIEMWYAVLIDVENPALLPCVITAKYQNEPLGNVLSSLQFLLKLKITRNGEGHYIINGEGCK